VGQFLESPRLASLNEILETIYGVGGEVHLVKWSTNLVTSTYLSFLPPLPCSRCPLTRFRMLCFNALAVQHQKIKCLWWQHGWTNKFAQAVTLPTYIREVPGSNFFRDTDYPDWDFWCLFSVPEGECWDRTLNSATTTSVYILSHSVFTVTQPLNTIRCELLRASLNKLQI
jgi:hypothetical protein